MSVNTLEMLMTFSKSLESGSNSNDITYVIDILKAIKKEAPTKEVIQKATKVGSQISSLRKKFQSSANNSELLSLCKDILTKWKATLGTEEESSSSTLKSPIAQLKLRLKPASTSSTSSSSSFDLSQLSDSRRRVSSSDVTLNHYHNLEKSSLIVELMPIFKS